MRDTLQFIVAGSEVTRYHTVRTIERESVGHHSHGVACLLLLLNPWASRRSLITALWHDLAEHQTGDIPSPAKQSLNISNKAHELELQIMANAGLEMPELTAEEARTLKLADLAQSALFCAQELSMGNRRMQPVFDCSIAHAEKMTPIGRERKLFDAIKDLALPHEHVRV